MKGYRFITSDDTSEFCHRMTEAERSSNTKEIHVSYVEKKKID